MPAVASSRTIPKSPVDHATCVGRNTLRLWRYGDNTLKNTWDSTASATSAGERAQPHLPPPLHQFRGPRAPWPTRTTPAPPKR
eukprot:2794153-Pyramimonas_sp.AAC.1